MKKKNARDATERNVRASNKWHDWFKLRLIELEARVKVLEKAREKDRKSRLS